MGDRKVRNPGTPSRVGDTRFWDDVEREIDTLDVQDFEEFLNADTLSTEPRVGFYEELREELRPVVLARKS
jgi:hypothetical protein